MVRVAVCDDDILFASKLEEEIIEISKHTGIDMESEIYYDGTTTVRHIRKLDYTSLLIFVSSYEQYLKELFEVEPFRFLSKRILISL